MILILLLGWGVLVFHLETRSAWYDEPATYDALKQGFPAVITWTAKDVHPPLYYLYVILWEKLLSTRHLTALRISSLFPALLALAMCYRIGTDWFKNQWAGIFASAFLATNGLFVHYGTDLRMYTLVIWLAALNWWSFWLILQNNRRGMILYPLTLAMLAYTHYFSAFAIVPQIPVLLLFYRTAIRKFLFCAFGTGLIFMPWLPTAISQIQVAQNQGGTEVTGKTLGTNPTTLTTIFDLISRYTAGNPAFVALLILLAFLLINRKDLPRYRWNLISLLWLFLPLFAFFGINLFIRIYALRYTLPALVALSLVIGSTALYFHTRIQRLAILGLLISINLYSIPQGFVVLSTDTPHRTLIQYIDQRYQPNDLIWYHMANGALGSSTYGLDIHLGTETDHITLDSFVWDAPHDFANQKNRPRVWYAHSYWVNPPEDVLTALEAGRFVTDNFIYEGYLVTLYKAPSDQDPASFSDLFQFRNSNISNLTISGEESLQINTWWMAQRQIDKDYSVVLQIRQNDSQSIITQYDFPIAAYASIVEKDMPIMTGSWESAENYYVPLTIDLENLKPSEEYEVWLGVYYWEEPAMIEVTSSGDFIQSDNLETIKLGTIEISD